MVRWKKSSRRPSQRQLLEDLVEEMSSEDVEDSEEEVKAMNDGEGEDNYRDPMIRLAYISVIILAMTYSPIMLLFIFFVELSVYANKESRIMLHEQRMNAGLRTPSMEKILEDRSRFRQEIKFLKSCNSQLTNATWINALLEISGLAYSLFLLSINQRHLYPTFHLLLHWFTRVNHVYTEVYGRFYAPEDVVGALFAEVFYDGISRYFHILKQIVTVSDYLRFVPCRLELLIFPLFLAILQVFANQKHCTVYENERQMRKQVRERFLRDGPVLYFASI